MFFRARRSAMRGDLAMMKDVQPAKSIEPFRVMAILAKARELEARGRSIIHLEIGEPDFPTPQPITAAGIRALEKGDSHYAEAAGIPELREAIADFYAGRYGLTISPGRIIVTPGASGALLLALSALIRPDDRVLVTDPGYPCHRHVAGVMGGEAVKVPLDERHQLSEEVVTNFWDDRSRALILASPSNPTGALTSDKTLAAITDFVRSRDGALISDEIYHGLTYGRDAPSALVFSDQVFVINSFSKYWGMTGWRLGWLIGPPAFAAELERLAQNLFLASSTIAQHAALAAFLPETLAIVEDRRKEFHSRRDLMLPALADTGFEIDARPEGAFYIYARCTRFSPDSAVFCDELLEKAGVALTPGIDFGSHRAQEHLRLAYTANSARLMEAIQRIGNFVRSL